MKKLLYSFFVFLFAIGSSYCQEFTGSFDVFVTQKYKNGNSRTDTISYYFNVDRTAMIIHGRQNQPDMRMIFNFSDTTITNLFEMNGRKGGYILPMDDEHWPGLAYIRKGSAPCEDGSIEYSGKSKAIEGYVCKEVIADNAEYNGKLWVTNEIPLSMRTILSYQSVGKGKSKKEIELFDQMNVSCLPLEMDLESKLGKADVQLRIANISDDVPTAVFSSEGHEVNRITE